MKIAYYGIIYPHMTYGIILWGYCNNNEFQRLFVLQKKAIRIIKKLKPRESCKTAFNQLKILTLPSLFILKTILYFRFKCKLQDERHFHDYNTRFSHIPRSQQHRLKLFEHLPIQGGRRLFKVLPNYIKIENSQRIFKKKLTDFLVSEAFYSVDEFIDHTEI